MKKKCLLVTVLLSLPFLFFPMLVAVDQEEEVFLLLVKALEENKKEDVEQLMKHSDYNTLFAYELTRVLIAAIEKYSDKKIVEKLMQHPNFSKVSTFDIADILQIAVKNGHKDIVALLIKHQKFSENDINAAIALAQEKDYQGITHLIKAYTALKPVTELFKKDEKGRKRLNARYPAYARQVIEAYKQFLKGNSQDLRRLVLLIKSNKAEPLAYMYALENFGYAHDQAMILIGNTLFDVFKKDNIKSLLLALVQTKKQKIEVLDLLSEMGLSDWGKKQRAATKIQALWRDRQVRKGVIKQQSQQQHQNLSTAAAASQL